MSRPGWSQIWPYNSHPHRALESLLQGTILLLLLFKHPPKHCQKMLEEIPFKKETQRGSPPFLSCVNSEGTSLPAHTRRVQGKARGTA